MNKTYQNKCKISTVLILVTTLFTYTNRNHLKKKDILDYKYKEKGLCWLMKQDYCDYAISNIFTQDFDISNQPEIILLYRGTKISLIGKILMITDKPARF